jgi:hypothetical protein
MSKRTLTAAEEKAVKRVEAAIEALPKSIALYFHGQGASVVACESDGALPIKGVGIDRSANLGSIDTPRCEAGDW